MKSRTVQTYFQNSVLRHAGAGLAVLIAVALGVAFFIAREEASSQLQESAKATVQAFGDRILDGDIKLVELQVNQLLKIQTGETAKILKTDLSRIYAPVSEMAPDIHACSTIGSTCFDGFFGPVRILYPITMDANSSKPYRYLYLSKAVHLNWYILTTIFGLLSVGFFGLVMAFIRVSRIASDELGREILTWSQRLQANPKDATPLSVPPFAELLPLKAAIEGLNSQIEKFEQTAIDRAKFLILRGIGHDLLTPVFRLQLYTATLESNIDIEENADALSEIKDALYKVTKFASQVKILREVEPTVESSEIISAINEELNSLQSFGKTKEKSIQFEFKHDKSAIFSPFSKIEVSRIISNLVENAVDASPNGSTVNIEAGASEENIYFSVSDQGTGIPQSHIGQIFEPDFTSKPSTGTGLGLTIVKYLCERRSAKIDLDSNIGEGTKIKISVPVAGRMAYA